MRTLRTTVRPGQPRPTDAGRWLTRQTDVCRSFVGRSSARRAFTLVELLVAISILVLLTALVLASFRRSDADRLNASARMLQSYFEGARSRAISDDRPRGVRLIRSTSDPGVVSSVAYIGSPGFDGDDGATATVVYDLGVGMWRMVNTSGKWQRLAPKSAANPNGRDLIRPGLRIEAPRDSGSWYVVSPFQFDTQINAGGFYIEGHYTPSVPDGSGGYLAQPDQVPYRLELASTILPNTEPVQLQNGIVIDLDASQIPPSWRDNPLAPSTPPPLMDILFDSRGSPTGPIATAGLIHLYVTTIADVEMTRGQDPNHPHSGTATGSFVFPYVPARAPVVPKTEPYVLTLFTQSGQVTTGRVDATNTNSDPWADDPYSYARRGREAQ